MADKLVIIDGNSIMNRAFYGLSGKNMLMNKDGIPTNAIFGFLVIFCFPLKLVFCFGLPISIVNAILSLLPYMILRYNIPRLHRMRNLLEKKELRQQK